MIKKGDKMDIYDKLDRFICINITKNCNSNKAYEKCKRYIISLNPTNDQYEKMIKIVVDWIGF
jgi:hypothetical protein